MGEKIGIVVASILFIGLMLFTLWSIEYENKTMIYECTDFQGNLVYCTSAYTSKGGMFGTTEDGTRIALTSYKLIPKTERKDIGVKE